MKYTLSESIPEVGVVAGLTLDAEPGEGFVGAIQALTVARLAQGGWKERLGAKMVKRMRPLRFAEELASQWNQRQEERARAFYRQGLDTLARGAMARTFVRPGTCADAEQQAINLGIVSRG